MSTGHFVGYFSLLGVGAERGAAWMERALTGLAGSATTASLGDGAGAIAFLPTASAGACRETFVSPRDGGFAFVDGALDETPVLRAALGSAVDSEGSAAALVLAAHRRWGPTLPERLYGDFVAIAWQPGAPLLCCLSPGGGRWLYYSLSGHELRFSDRPELLLDSSCPRGDRTYFASLMQGCFSGHRTPFEEVSRLRPGHALRFDQGGARELRWWRVPRPGSVRHPHRRDYEQHLRRVLRAAVRRNMEGHRRVCISLSAGIDSGAVAVCAREVAEETGAELLALTFATPDDPLADESPVAREAAAALGIDHRAVSIGREPEPLDAMLDLASTLPFPTGHVVFARPLTALARTASEWGATLLLNGAGGELHAGGFDYFLALLRSRRYARLLREVLTWRARGFSLTRQALEVVTSVRETGLGGRLHRPRKPWLLREPVEAASDPSVHPMLSELERFLTQEAIGAEMHQALYSAFGVTTAAPHLDRRVLELALATPLELRVQSNPTDLNKPLLRSAFPEISEANSRAGDRVNLGEHAASTWIECAARADFIALLDRCSPVFADVIDYAKVRQEMTMLRQSSEEMHSADLVAAALWDEANRRRGISMT